jgi:Cu/Ag efflux pump CusA
LSSHPTNRASRVRSVAKAKYRIHFWSRFDLDQHGGLFVVGIGGVLASAAVTADLLQMQDRIIKSFPEVASVFGKAGRASTSTDPAPTEMYETVINLKPKDEWRPGVTIDSLIAEMDKALQFPGVSNAWTMPIKARIDMLSTGIRTPVGVKVFGTDLTEMEKVARQIEQVLKAVPGTSSAYAEAIILLPLYLNFRRLTETLIVMLSLPFSVVGGVWLLWWLGFNLSVAVAVGFIALAGVAAETGMVMLIYLDHALRELKEKCTAEGRRFTRSDLQDAIMLGAVERVRPKMMTVVAIIACLLPIMWSAGTGSEVMQRIAVPMIGGMVSSTVLTLLVIPAVYGLIKGRGLRACTLVRLMWIKASERRKAPNNIRHQIGSRSDDRTSCNALVANTLRVGALGFLGSRCLLFDYRAHRACIWRVALSAPRGVPAFVHVSPRTRQPWGT